MQLLNLGGDWLFRQSDKADSLPALVPGCVHADLLRNEAIDDPYYSDNEQKQMWIGETDWVYTRQFQIDRSFLDTDRIELVCDGIDTLATIKINGRVAGKTDNAFRTWRLDAKRLLRVGTNDIEVLFRSTIPYIKRQQKKHHLALSGANHHRIDGSNHIRKSQSNYGWDWGPMCVTCGIWRDIRLESIETARLTNVHVTQDHRQRNSVGIDVSIDAVLYQSKSLTAEIVLKHGGEEVIRQSLNLADGSGARRITVTDPNYWWPNGLGDRSLYEVTVILFDAAKKEQDRWSRSIGLRTVELIREPDKWGESFHFAVNGKPFFTKGANWIPADTFVTRISPEWYRYLIESAAAANMNMLRVWGGGIYEPDVFYDLCDEYGILVWQDFMFACSAYPVHDEQFVQSVKSEATDNIMRLRHHPSMAVWCGNNEIEQMHESLLSDTEEPSKMTWDDYKAVFDDLLPGLVKKLSPDLPYWPSSPHSPGDERLDYNNPGVGDAHLWAVWHGRRPFEWYRTCEHRFNSEFGFQSFPEPSVVDAYTTEEERNIASYTMELHQRSGIGNDAIIQYMLSWFRLPHSFHHTLWLSQILQGMAIKYAVEHWRRKMPQGMGTLYWQLNDCWPVASWSSIDFPGTWKALNYMARDFYAPLLVSAVEDSDTGSLEVWVSNDHVRPREGVIRWQVVSTAGESGSGGTVQFKISGSRSKKIKTVDLRQDLQKIGPRSALVSLKLEVDGEVVSTNFTTYVRPKHITLQDPLIAAKIREVGDNTFEVALQASKPALWVWPDLAGAQATYSDRFFHLLDKTGRTVTIRPWEPMTLKQVEESLVVSSLKDTY